MVDVLSPEKRSQNMAKIKARNTKPELIVRRALHQRGFRFRLHKKNLAGKPDIVLAKHCTVIFVNGCFWHGHDCHLFKWPKSNESFWYDKISANKVRDINNVENLKLKGWNVITVWECSIRGKRDALIDKYIDLLSEEIRRCNK